MKLSEENVAKLNFKGLYSHSPDVKYRGKLYADDLYCFQLSHHFFRYLMQHKITRIQAMNFKTSDR